MACLSVYECEEESWFMAGEAEAEKGCEGAGKKKYEFLEDLPGVGPATAQKLREMGYHTV